MAETAALAIAEAVGGDYVTAAFIEFAINAAVTVSSVYTLRETQRKQQASARAAYENSLRDRYLMLRGATEQRQVVLGRQRVSGPMAYVGSYGANREHLVFVLILAAHEIDGVETIYFDDEPVALDGTGQVVGVQRRDLFTITAATDTFTLSSEPSAGSVVATVAYGTTTVTLGTTVTGTSVAVTGATAGQTGTVTVTYQPAQSPYAAGGLVNEDDLLTLDSSGNGSATLSHAPEAGSVRVVLVGDYSDSGSPDVDITAFASVSGSTVTVAGAPAASVTATVRYDYVSSPIRARVRAYLGAPGQTADPGMLAALPDVWTTDHVMTGLAHLVVECDYDPDAFPSGLMNVSAAVRGAKLYDPRTGLTAFSENPALMMRYVALSPLLGRQQAAYVHDTSINTNATVCDTSASYVVDGRTYTRPLYTAGLTVKAGTRAKDALDDLAMAMAGRWVYIDGQLRVQAGTYVTPLQTLDDTWLSAGQPVRYQARANRSDVFNIATGKFADAQRDYRTLDFPRVESAEYIAEDGAPLEADYALNAVTFAGQAQQVVACLMRDARLGERLTVLCNMRAYAVEVFDTLTVNLSRWGMDGEVYQVLDVNWTLEGILLSLKRTGPSVWAMGTSFAAMALPGNTRLPSPFEVPAVAGLALASGTAQLAQQADGTIVSRLQVSWTAPTDALVLEGGGTEVRYGLAAQPESEWHSVVAERGQDKLWLSDVRDGSIYLLKARHFNALVRGRFVAPLMHQVVGKTALPANVAGLSTGALPGGVQVSWTPSTEVDHLETEVRHGASWAAGTQIFKGPAASFVWPWPAAGTYTLRARHRDRSGNESASDATASVTVNDGNLVGTAALAPNSATEVLTAYVAGPVDFSSGA